MVRAFSQGLLIAFISTRFTWVPQVGGSVWVGAKLMGLDLDPLVHELHRRDLWSDLGRLWLPLLLGALVLGPAAAASAIRPPARSRPAGFHRPG